MKTHRPNNAFRKQFGRQAGNSILLQRSVGHTLLHWFCQCLVCSGCWQGGLLWIRFTSSSWWRPGHFTISPLQAFSSCLPSDWGFAQQEVQNPSYEKIATITAVKTAGRLANAALFVDIKTSIPIQLMISLLEVRSAWQQNPNSLYLHFLLQMNVSLIVLAVSGLLEISVRSRIAMLLDSESMVSSFRKMLRGVCDGEVLLDSDFKISGKADCLKTILMTGHDFSGQDFEKLLVEEERERFRTFMKEPLAISTPCCLRVSLKRGRIRVGVDLFHVKVPHLFGKAIHHLVALREDAESRLRQEATDAYVGGIPSVLAESGSPKSRSKRSKSAISASSAQACAMLQLSNELQEMTLLIDAATPM